LVLVGRDGESMEEALLRHSREHSEKLIAGHERQAESVRDASFGCRTAKGFEPVAAGRPCHPFRVKPHQAA
jgi:hypothetical protein